MFCTVYQRAVGPPLRAYLPKNPRLQPTQPAVSFVVPLQQVVCLWATNNNNDDNNEVMQKGFHALMEFLDFTNRILVGPFWDVVERSEFLPFLKTE